MSRCFESNFLEGLAASEGEIVGRIWKADQLLVGGAPCQVRALPPPALALCTNEGVLPVLFNANDVARRSIFGGLAAWLCMGYPPFGLG